MRHIHPYLQHCDANCGCCRPLDEEAQRICDLSNAPQEEQEEGETPWA